MTYQDVPNEDIESDPAHVAAAEWLVRLQGEEVTLEDTMAWQAWLNESPHHALAFARMEEVAQMVRNIPAQPGVSGHEWGDDRYDGSIPLKKWKPLRRAARSWVALALACAIAGVAFTLLLTHTPGHRFSTAIGEIRTIKLEDGSTVALGGDTRIEVRLSAQTRSIELKKGEALFTVAKDADRPFRVRVGRATVVALGTSFDIQRRSDRAIVSVTEGKVLVEPVAYFFHPKLRTVHLDAGQQTSAGNAGIEEPTKVEDPVATTSWQTGRLAFRLEPLRYVLEDVNRYARKPIVMEDSELGALVITGTVEQRNIDGWISSLERAFDLEAREEGTRIVLKSRQGT